MKREPLHPVCCVGVELALRKELRVQPMRRRMMLVAVMLAGPIALIPRVAAAEGLFALFSAGQQKQQQRQAPAQASFFADPFGLNQQPAPPRPVAAAGSGPPSCGGAWDGR